MHRWFEKFKEIVNAVEHGILHRYLLRYQIKVTCSRHIYHIQTWISHPHFTTTHHIPNYVKNLGHIDGLVQYCSIFSELETEIMQSSTKPSIQWKLLLWILL